jgi:hypothetical protein
MEMPDIWEKHPDEFYHEWIIRQHTGSMRFPLLWLVTAYRLKRAADHLFAVSEVARNKFLERTMAEHRARKKGMTLPEPLSNEDEINLHTDMDQISTYFMLTGLAIENIAKGILVVRDPDLVSDEGEFKLNTHNLAYCVEQCGLVLSVREKEVLNALKEFIVWAGRYPGRVKVFLPKRMPDGSFEDKPHIGFHDHDLIEALFMRVYELLAEIMKAEKEKLQERDENGL